MKFDMHCHTREGSLDGKVSLEEYIVRLKELGYDGMLITDHNSYDAYRYWKKNIKGQRHTDFVVLKGIEYDTINAGHMLVIMPENVKLRILELRGMPLPLLIFIVHTFGGIIGPAHPYGEKYMSLMHTRYYKKNKEILKKFDFMETFNACEPAQANMLARKTANEYGLPGFGGSDSHRMDCVGTAYTRISAPVEKESDLIALVKEKAPMQSGGSLYRGTTRDRIGKMHNVLLYSFWVYNKVAGLTKVRKRRGESRYLHIKTAGSSSYRTD
ncbi:MAG: PHP domain-containing protein [Eubacteriales bacterium]|nr:PHP domain-containing protein [Eubacteriales bacterium]